MASSTTGGQHSFSALTATAMAVAVLWHCAAIAGAVVLIDDGAPKATIVVPESATETVQFAAREMQRYLEQMSAAAIPIVAEPKGAGATLHVGPTRVAKPLIPPAAEGIVIHSDAGRVVVCGGSDRGTLFAVYRLLEELGCRWLAPDQEFVPRRTTIEVQAMDLRTAPAFNMRTFVARDETRRAWGVKMGMNGFYTAQERALHGNGYYLPDAVSGCHAYHQIIPAEIYFDKHPEWFPLLQGERRPGKVQGVQLCVTAPGLADEFAKRVIAVFDADPELNIISISPNDGRGWCECDRCVALDRRLCGGRTTKQGLAGESPFRGDRVFWFANQVAERVAKVHPDKLLLVLAYINYAEPPDTIVPAKNVVPWLCHYAPADYSRPISDPTSKPNAQFNELLVRWAKQAPHLLFYSYVSKSMWWRLPRPVTHNFAADLKYLYQLGIRRYYCQSGLNDWAEAGPLYYVLCKLLWDPRQDPDAIIADWVRHMFGPAAEEMSDFYAAVERSVQASGKPFSDNPPRDVPGLYSHEDLERASGHLAAAMRAAASDDVALARVKQVERIFRYGRHMIAALEAAHRYRQSPTVALKQTIERETAKAWEIYPYRYSKRYFAGIQMRDQLGVISSGFGKGEQKGGRLCWNSDETGPGDGAAGWALFYITVDDPTRPVRVEMDVWGTSTLNQIVINTGGARKSYANGGIWNPVKPLKPLSGKEQWDTLVFNIPVELLAKDKPSQAIGFGGGDSQVWVAAIRCEQEDE